MPTRKTNRRNTEVDGVIFPDAVYDTRAVMRYAGLGREQLVDLRRNGQLTPGKSKQGRTWYRGSELIEVIFGESRRKAGAA